MTEKSQINNQKLNWSKHEVLHRFYNADDQLPADNDEHRLSFGQEKFGGCNGKCLSSFCVDKKLCTKENERKKNVHPAAKRAKCLEMNQSIKKTFTQVWCGFFLYWEKESAYILVNVWIIKIPSHHAWPSLVCTNLSLATDWLEKCSTFAKQLGNHWLRMWPIIATRNGILFKTNPPKSFGWVLVFHLLFT